MDLIFNKHTGDYEIIDKYDKKYIPNQHKKNNVTNNILSHIKILSTYDLIKNYIDKSTSFIFKDEIKKVLKQRISKFEKDQEIYIHFLIQKSTKEHLSAFEKNVIDNDYHDRILSKFPDFYSLSYNRLLNDFKKYTEFTTEAELINFTKQLLNVKEISVNDITTKISKLNTPHKRPRNTEIESLDSILMSMKRKK